MRHTPKPWRLGQRGAVLGHFGPDRPDGGFWAEVCKVELEHSDKSGYDNLYLVAAAPDLLDAAEWLLDLMRGSYRGAGWIVPGQTADKIADRFKSVVDRAKGQQDA